MKNKNQFERILIYDKAFQSGKYFSKDMLIEKINKKDIEISDRQFYNDIKYLRDELKAPIVNHRTKGYYYSNPSFSINGMELTKEELKHFRMTTSLLTSYGHLDIFDSFGSILNKLVQNANIISDTATKEKNILAFESIPEMGGIKYIKRLANAIEKEKVLSITYETYSSNSIKKYTIHPYFLKEYRNRWYILGLNDQNKQIFTLALDRIHEIEILSNKFYIQIDFDPKAHFEHAIGITVNTQSLKPEKISMWFSPRQSKYIISQPLHPSQEIIKNNTKGLWVDYYLTINYELIATILSYGEDCKILAPNHLSNQIKEKVSELTKLYS